MCSNNVYYKSEFQAGDKTVGDVAVWITAPWKQLSFNKQPFQITFQSRTAAAVTKKKNQSSRELCYKLVCGSTNLFVVAKSVVAKSPLGDCLLLQHEDVQKVILMLQISDLLSRCHASLRFLRV